MAKLYFYKTIEVIFCFIFTFFPNLSIEMHLQINREKIERARQQVNNLLPDSYPAEVNANINPWFLSYDVKKFVLFTMKPTGMRRWHLLAHLWPALIWEFISSIIFWRWLTWQWMEAYPHTPSNRAGTSSTVNWPVFWPICFSSNYQRPLNTLVHPFP